MSDRELLELAAKAAGLNGYVYEWVGGPYYIVPADPNVSRSEPKTYDWLNDDGDALRLANKVGISVTHAEPICVAVHEFQGHKDGEYQYGCQAWLVSKDGSTIDVEEVYGSDRDAATRRAIVRAAAEIGRGDGEGGK